MGLSGAILVVQASAQARIMIGDLSAVGPAFLQLLVRQYGPAVVALMVAARYGAATAAEIGTLTITEQVDALRMAGASPVAYLVAPRVLAGGIGMIPLVTLGSAIAFAAGAVVGNLRFGIGWDSFWRSTMVTHGDVLTGAVKALVFGVTVPLCACRAGLRARGGASGVGKATTRAVIGASVAVLFFDLLIGVVGYVVLDVLDVLGPRN
jgi:phospholipid/cholesterol/gamma-HCH transport system permease protein